MTSPVPSTRDRFPPAVKYLAGNEAAERFSYYGMTSILALYMARNLGIAENESIAWYQLFTFAAYGMPMIGAIIADRWWGRYRTILILSFGYVAGHAVLAIWESGTGLAVGLALIAIGAGGIKPCASAFAGDQIPPGDETQLSRLYNLWYWMINIGSTAGTLVIPLLLDRVSPRVAFGVPGLAMAAALLVFWLGRRKYVRVPPARLAPPRSVAEREADVGDLGIILRIVAVFVPVIAFWALFFQYGSAWTLQADRMNRDVFGFRIAAGQVQTLDAAFVLTLIPVFATVIYPAIERMGLRVTPLRKMTAGMFIMTLSFVAAGMVQARLDAGIVPHVAWQIPQYLFLAIGEVLVSVTALEFAYSQAPARWKSIIMGLWFLTIASGSLLTAAVAALNRFQGVAYYNFFAALMLGAAFLFAIVAWFYRPVESTRTAAAA